MYCRYVSFYSLALHVLPSQGQLCLPRAGRWGYSWEASSARTGSHIDCPVQPPYVMDAVTIPLSNHTPA